MLEADATFLPEFRQEIVDVAYVVANRGFRVQGGIYTSDNTFEWGSLVLIDVPEPGTAFISIAFLLPVYFPRRDR